MFLQQRQRNRDSKDNVLRSQDRTLYGKACSLSLRSAFRALYCYVGVRGTDAFVKERQSVIVHRSQSHLLETLNVCITSLPDILKLSPLDHLPFTGNQGKDRRSIGLNLTHPKPDNSTKNVDIPLRETVHGEHPFSVLLSTAFNSQEQTRPRWQCVYSMLALQQCLLRKRK